LGVTGELSQPDSAGHVHRVSRTGNTIPDPGDSKGSPLNGETIIEVTGHGLPKSLLLDHVPSTCLRHRPQKGPAKISLLGKKGLRIKETKALSQTYPAPEILRTCGPSILPHLCTLEAGHFKRKKKNSRRKRSK